MRFLLRVFPAFAVLTAWLPAIAQSPVLDAPAASVAIQFWTSLKADDGREKELVADGATFDMMGLGGPYSHDIMHALVSHCDVVGVLGGDAKDPGDPTAYVWILLECSENGKIETLPLGLGIRDAKVSQLEVDMFSGASIDRSMIERK